MSANGHQHTSRRCQVIYLQRRHGENVNVQNLHTFKLEPRANPVCVAVLNLISVISPRPRQCAFLQQNPALRERKRDSGGYADCFFAYVRDSK